MPAFDLLFQAMAWPSLDSSGEFHGQRSVLETRGMLSSSVAQRTWNVSPASSSRGGAASASSSAGSAADVCVLSVLLFI